MSENVYGYVRVSTKEQNLDRQILALHEFGIPENMIFQEKQSGKDFERPVYKRLVKKLKPGDTLLIKSIDRLGRNYDEILEQWRILTKEKQVDIEVIDMPLLNTDYERDGLTGVFVTDLVLQILAYVAETERRFIRQRQAEGIASAKRRGVKFGAVKTPDPQNLKEYYEKWKRGEISIRKAASELGIHYSLFYRRCIELKKEENERFLK